MLTNAELCDEHNAIYYNPIGWMTVELWAFLCPGVVEIMKKKRKTERNKKFRTID